MSSTALEITAGDEKVTFKKSTDTKDYYFLEIDENVNDIVLFNIKDGEFLENI